MKKAPSALGKESGFSQISRFSRQPCRHCKEETLHVSSVCIHCKRGGVPIGKVRR